VVPVGCLQAATEDAPQPSPSLSSYQVGWPVVPGDVLHGVLLDRLGGHQHLVDLVDHASGVPRHVVAVVEQREVAVGIPVGGVLGVEVVVVDAPAIASRRGVEPKAHPPVGGSVGHHGAVISKGVVGLRGARRGGDGEGPREASAPARIMPKNMDFGGPVDVPYTTSCGRATGEPPLVTNHHAPIQVRNFPRTLGIHPGPT